MAPSLREPPPGCVPSPAARADAAGRNFRLVVGPQLERMKAFQEKADKKTEAEHWNALLDLVGCGSVLGLAKWFGQRVISLIFNVLKPYVGQYLVPVGDPRAFAGRRQRTLSGFCRAVQPTALSGDTRTICASGGHALCGPGCGLRVSYCVKGEDWCPRQSVDWRSQVQTPCERRTLISKAISARLTSSRRARPILINTSFSEAICARYSAASLVAV